MSALLKLKYFLGYLWCTGTTVTVCRIHFYTKLKVRKSIFSQNFTEKFKKLIGDNANMTGNYQSPTTICSPEKDLKALDYLYTLW